MKLTDLTKEQWDKALIIFDTSSICKMYDMTDSTKSTMMDILEYLKSRIFIPGQVWVEYIRNREKVIQNPISERYTLPKCFNNTILKEEGRNFIATLGNTKYYHPFISEEIHEEVSNTLKTVIENLARIKDAIQKEFDKRKEEIKSLVKEDTVYKKLATLDRGKEFDFEETLAIIESEGELRYRHRIPPGYMDIDTSKGNPKTSIDAFGDLFVWKQVIEESNRKGKDVVFVCNDEKEDWWKNWNKKTFREELVKEFTDKTSHTIYAIDLEGFIQYLENRYAGQTNLSFYKGLEKVRDVLDYYSHFTSPDLTEDDVFVYLKCSRCGYSNRIALQDIDFNWDEEENLQKPMGLERDYSYLVDYECKHCREFMGLDFRLIEYPEGKIEDFSIECEECEIENSPNWMRRIKPFFVRDIKTCRYCGRHVDYLFDGMCSFCYQTNISRDNRK